MAPASSTCAPTLSLGPEAGALLDAIPGPAMLLDPLHRILAANPAMARSLGVPLDGLLGRHCPTLAHGTDAPPDYCPLQAHKRTGGQASTSVDVRDPTTGSWRRFTVTPTALRTSEGEPVFLHTSRDIEREVRSVEELDVAREALQHNLDAQRIVAAILRRSVEDAELEAIFADTLRLLTHTAWLSLQSKGAIFTLDPVRGALRLRASVGMRPALVDQCRLLPLGRCLCGRAAETGAAVLASHLDHRHEVTIEGMIDHGHACLPIRFEDRVLGVLNVYVAPGHRVTAAQLSFLETVAHTLASVIAREEAERRRRLLQAELRHTQKMDAIGRLAGGVAHDFNNLLAVIQGYGEMVADDLGPDHAVAADMQEVLGAAASAGALTRQLLGLSRRGPVEPEVLAPDQTLVGMKRMLARLLGERVVVAFEVGAPEARLHIDRSHLEQILLNLVVNARDAMPTGGRLRVSTCAREPDLSVETRPRWVLEVQDEGLGMTEDVRARVFDPFFTTKGEGRGTGLGLSTVRDIVVSYQGTVEVVSAPGVGTTMRILLPMHVSFVPLPTPRHMPSMRWNHSGTVLVVDDEVGVRNVVCRILTRRGFRVLEAGSAEAALELEASHASDIDVLVTDVVMPGLDGFGLARQLVRRRPGLATVFVSGYPMDMLAQYGLDHDEVAIVRKPFDAHALLDAIAAVREQRAPSITTS